MATKHRMATPNHNILKTVMDDAGLERIEELANCMEVEKGGIQNTALA